MNTKNVLKFVLSVLISESAGVIGFLFTSPAIERGWYESLTKPALTPLPWVFGPAWTMLYFLIGVSLYLVWKNDWVVVRPLYAQRPSWNKWSERFWRGDLQKENTISVFYLHYTLNVLWSVVFFGFGRPDIAFFVLLALWTAAVYLMVNFYRVSKMAAWLLVPYFVWVTFAVYLNFFTWVLNAS